MTRELKPCPFCGGPAEIEEVLSGIDGVRFSVGCTADEAHCMGYQSLTTFNFQSEAADAWNKRADELTASQAWSIVKKWVSGVQWEAETFGPLKDEVNIDGVMTAGQAYAMAKLFRIPALASSSPQEKDQ